MQFLFANELEALKIELNLKSKDVQRRTGVDIGTLSRIKHGERNVTFDHLRLICKAFPDRAPRLLRARLLDECHGPGGERIRIVLAETSAAMSDRDLAPPYLASLPPVVDDAMRVVAAHLGTDSKLRNMMLWIADRLKRANCCETNIPVDRASTALAAAALNEDAGGAPAAPAPNGGKTTPVRYGKGKREFSSATEKAAGRSIVDVAVAQSLVATNAPPPPAKPVSYKAARKSSKQKHSEHA